MSKTKREQIEDNLIAEEMEEGAAKCLKCGSVLKSDRVGFAGCRKCGQDYVIKNDHLIPITISAIMGSVVQYEEQALDDFTV